MPLTIHILGTYSGSTSNNQITKLIYHKHECLEYADDVALLKISKKDVVFKQLEGELKKFNIIVNEQKLKYMEMKVKITENNKCIKIKTERRE